MRTRIIKIGNSRGVRIPKPLLEQIGILEDVDMKVENNRIIISPVSEPRAGWDGEFQKMSENGDDLLLDRGEPALQEWDETEWEW